MDGRVRPIRWCLDLCRLSRSRSDERVTVDISNLEYVMIAGESTSVVSAGIERELAESLNLCKENFEKYRWLASLSVLLPILHGEMLMQGR